MADFENRFIAKINEKKSTEWEFLMITVPYYIYLARQSSSAQISFKRILVAIFVIRIHIVFGWLDPDPGGQN